MTHFIVQLYATQAAIYLTAALLYRSAGHRDLSTCYGASAAVHFGLAALHTLLAVG